MATFSHESQFKDALAQMKIVWAFTGCLCLALTTAPVFIGARSGLPAAFGALIALGVLSFLMLGGEFAVVSVSGFGATFMCSTGLGLLLLAVFQDHPEMGIRGGILLLTGLLTTLHTKHSVAATLKLVVDLDRTQVEDTLWRQRLQSVNYEEHMRELVRINHEAEQILSKMRERDKARRPLMVLAVTVCIAGICAACWLYARGGLR